MCTTGDLYHFFYTWLFSHFHPDLHHSMSSHSDSSDWSPPPPLQLNFPAFHQSATNSSVPSIHQHSGQNVHVLVMETTRGAQPWHKHNAPGAGFVGFLYTLGPLHSIHQNNDTSTLQQYDDGHNLLSSIFSTFILGAVIKKDTHATISHASTIKYNQY